VTGAEAGAVIAVEVLIEQETVPPVRIVLKRAGAAVDWAPAVLAAGGWQGQTALVERRHLALRPRVAAGGRRGKTLGQGAEGVQQQRVVFKGAHHLGLPPARWRQPGRMPEPTTGHGAAQRWRPGTLALAAGVTDHGWSRQAGRRFRWPPGPQAQAV
jgi:hypothetical protein